MNHLYLVIDFLLTHKFIFTLFIIGLITIIRKIVLSKIRGDVAFITENSVAGCREQRTGLLLSLSSSCSYYGNRRSMNLPCQ